MLSDVSSRQRSPKQGQGAKAVPLALIAASYNLPQHSHVVTFCLSLLSRQQKWRILPPQNSVARMLWYVAGHTSEHLLSF